MRSQSLTLKLLPLAGALIYSLVGLQANAQTGAPTLRQSIDADVLRHALHGDVWLVRPQSIYYCPGHSLYGKYAGGVFLSEEVATSAGARSAIERPCNHTTPVQRRSTQ